MKRNALAWAAIVLSTAALVSSRGVTRAVPAAPQISPEGQQQARALSDAFNAVAEFVKPSVVQISVVHGNRSARLPNGRGPVDPHGNMNPNMGPKELEDMLRQFFGPEGRLEKQQFGGGGRSNGTGSGFVYDDKGHIVTNNHVVEGAEKITVTFSDGEEYSAKVVGTDPKSDVAVIKVEATDYRPLPRGKSSKVRVGDWVLAVGSPFGFDQSVTSGIISAIGRGDSHMLGDDAYEDFLQTDAAINPGNSGGPLVDLEGRVIGINSVIATSTRSSAGVGFAIPIDMAANLAERLIKDGKVNRVLLGIGLGQLTPALAKQFGYDSKLKGVLVASVLPDSPAAKAGLKVGDVITGFDGTPAVAVPSFRNLVSTSEPNKEFTLTYLREGKEMTAKVTLAPAETLLSARAERAGRGNRPEARKPEPAKAAVDGFGLTVQELTADLSKQFGYPEGAKGVVISDVKEDSPADSNGLKAGLLITSVLKDKKLTPIESPKQFEEIAANANELTVHVQTPDGAATFIPLAKPSK
ncbi:trypsin-like peptidase domain-containing protein [Tundrisphaera sp. TA3]|uniref:trypsin-like peptidase domain-containing protein n=1 Tax=Tundrisphaera sp. TA3 TaxID=3435775 RepID=UPI003EBA39BD